MHSTKTIITSHAKSFAFIVPLLSALILLADGTARASDIQVTSAVREGDDITFNLAWENSWREVRTIAAGMHVAGEGELKVENWDAAWVFVKFRRAGAETWSHATLSINAAEHSVPDGAKVDVGRTPRRKQGPGVGTFVYRSESNRGRGANDWKVKLRWLRRADDVADGEDVEVQVHAIEMVYVAEGPFAIGSGGDEEGRLFRADDPSRPFIVTSEAEIVTEPDREGALWGAGGAVAMSAIEAGKIKTSFIWSEPWRASAPVTVGNTGKSEGHDAVWIAGDFKEDDEIPPIHAEFPKGFRAFYCMKYEITQGQYAAFLNSLSRRQCGGTISISDNSQRYYVRSPLSHRYSLHGNWPNIRAGMPLVACNFLSWQDGISYAAWAGLRPMTELEFEKACRGPLKPVPNEYAWGTAGIADTRYQLVPGSEGTAKERVTENASSKTAGNAVYDRTRPDFGTPRPWSRPDAKIGPLRAGIFTSKSPFDRVASGASFWGIMELSGNLWERPVSIVDRRRTERPPYPGFMGMHGDGSIRIPRKDSPDRTGDWGDGGFRGGHWMHSVRMLRVSDRVSANAGGGGVGGGANRYAHYGFRAVRTTP
jgi:hypothetical protein